MCVCVWRVVDGAKEGRRWVRVNVVQRWPSILPHLTRCSRPHAHLPSGVAPPNHPSCISTDSCCVSLFMSGVCVGVGVVVPGTALLSLSLSLFLCPPHPFLRHTHAGDLIHRVYDHLASPRHRGCVAMNTMRVGYNSNRWPPFSFGSAERTSSFQYERVGGRLWGGVDICV